MKTAKILGYGARLFGCFDDKQQTTKPVSIKKKINDISHTEIELKNFSKYKITKLKGISKQNISSFVDSLQNFIKDLQYIIDSPQNEDLLMKLKACLKNFNISLFDADYGFTFIDSDITNIEANTPTKEIKNHISTFIKETKSLINKFNDNKNYGLFGKSFIKRFGTLILFFYPNKLFNAIKNNNIDLAELLISIASEKQMNKAFFVAVKSGNTKIVDMLIKKNVIPKVRDRDDNTALMLAIDNQQDEIINKLLADYSYTINWRNKRGETALHLAVKTGDARLVDMLIKKGADPNITDSDGYSPSTLAMKTGQTDIINILLASRKRYVDSKNKIGDTALHIAVKTSNASLVGMLIQNNATPTIQNIYGDTALMLAVETGQTEIIKILLASRVKINTNIKNNKGENILDIAIKNGNDEIIKKILENIIRFGITDKDRNHVLMFALENGYTDLLQQLINSGLNINDKDDLGNTVLMYAISRNDANLEIIEQLINLGANNLNVKNNVSTTPILKAITNGNNKVVKLLIEKSSLETLKQPDIFGITPIGYAKNKGYQDIIQQLVTAGVSF